MTDPPADHLRVIKDRRMVERHIDLYRELRPRRIVELGIHQGGSTALLHQLTTPTRLVAADIKERIPPDLSRYIDDEDAHDVVRPYCGVDQADRARVRTIIDAEFHGEPLDLVIDDASHLLTETRASFDVLLPRLRPGGVYVIEDWSGELLMHDAYGSAFEQLPDDAMRRALEAFDPAMLEPPLAAMLVELMLVAASRPDVVRRVTIELGLAFVQRGDAPLDARAFRLRDLYRDHFGLVVDTYRRRD